LLLHQHLTQDDLDDRATLRRVEAEADAFASAFLLPRETFLADVRQMRDRNLSSFLRLKARWGVSAQAMIRRARDLGEISADLYVQLCRAATMRRWRGAKQEPGDELVPAIKPTLGARSIQLLADSGIVQQWQFADQLPMPPIVWLAVAGINLTGTRPPELDTIIPFPSLAASESDEQGFLFKD
jgi:Zn-dependent peptidase ImmA (M78 family)